MHIEGLVVQRGRMVRINRRGVHVPYELCIGTSFDGATDTVRIDQGDGPGKLSVVLDRESAALVIQRTRGGRKRSILADPEHHAFTVNSGDRLSIFLPEQEQSGYITITALRRRNSLPVAA